MLTTATSSLPCSLSGSFLVGHSLYPMPWPGAAREALQHDCSAYNCSHGISAALHLDTRLPGMLAKAALTYHITSLARDSNPSAGKPGLLGPSSGGYPVHPKRTVRDTCFPTFPLRNLGSLFPPSSESAADIPEDTQAGW